MNISQVLKYEGPIEALVWKHPIEDFNTTSQLIVDETHEALLVVNGNACDLFGPGRHTMETGNIPIVKSIINIPTDGQTPFPCKVFFVNKVHQMDLTWGIPGEITLNDPVYDIFLHVGMCGNLNFQVTDSRKFLLKIVGFRDVFDGDSMVSKFRGIIKQYVKRDIAKMMNVDKVSYFDMHENLFDISEKVKENLIPLFDEYGVEVIQFNIESITVPDEDYEAVRRAKEARTSRVIQGYTWQEERKMDIAQTFAGNEGSMGGVSGAVGGFMVGGAFAGGMVDIAKSVINPTPNQMPNDTTEFIPHLSVNQEQPHQSPSEFSNNPIQQTVSVPQSGNQTSFCIHCGNGLTTEMVFCPKCGTKQAKQCQACHTSLMPDAKFCHKCGTAN